MAGTTDGPGIGIPRQEADTPQGGVRTLERGLRILRCFTVAHPNWSLARLSEATELHKATTRRLVKTLEAEGFLIMDMSTGEYRLGSALLPVAYLARSNEQLVSVAHPYIARLATRTEETVGVSVWTDSGPLLIDSVPTQHFFKPQLTPGSMSPEYGSTHAKIFLAFGPEERLPRLFVMDRNHPVSLCEVTSFQEKLEQVRRTGIAWDFEERIRGVCAVGVPVRDSTGEVVVSMAVVVPKDRFGEAERESFAALARETAAALSAELGYRP
ncbi:MAG: IclR family transcriptional regulator [Armatimonadetes bacterium]|nr:IclR family transcriptional regulator [Armatimonadota bacterium]